MGLYRAGRGRRPRCEDDIRHPCQRTGARGHRLRAVPRPGIRRPHVRGDRRRHRQMRRGRGARRSVPDLQRLLREGLPSGPRRLQWRGSRARHGQRHAVPPGHAGRGGGPLRAARIRRGCLRGGSPRPRARVREDIKCGHEQSASHIPRARHGPRGPGRGRGGCAPGQGQKNSAD